MKKLTLLLLFAFLSTSMLFAQSPELKQKSEKQTLQKSEEKTQPESLKLHYSEMKTTTNVKTMQKNEVKPALTFAKDSQNDFRDNNNNNDLAMNKQVQENEAKSKIAKEKRDKYSEAIALRLEKSENAKQKANDKKEKHERLKNMELDENGNPVNNNQLKN